MIKWRVLKKQARARKAKAEHLVKCSLAPGKGNVRRKPLSELKVNGNFTEDREEWQTELQRHCEEVSTDQEETREVQDNKIDYIKKKRWTSCRDKLPASASYDDTLATTNTGNGKRKSLQC